MIRLNNSIKFYSIGLLLCGLLLAVLWIHNVRSQNQAECDERFDELVKDVSGLLQTRMQIYEFGLRGARAAVSMVGMESMTRERFLHYAQSRNFALEFPGAHGFGLIRRVKSEQEAAFTASSRRDGNPDFSIRQLIPHDDERFVIHYVEPEKTNRQAIGLDVGSEKKRRAAALASMNSGLPVLTAPITIAQAMGKPDRSFLFLLPVYRGGMVSPSMDMNALGWVYAPLVIDEVLAGLDTRKNEYVMTLSDVSNAGMPEAFYSSAGGATVEGLEKRIRITMYGRKWMLEVKAQPKFVQRLNQSNPLFGGFVIGALFALLSGLMYFAMVISRRQQQDGLASQIIDAMPDAMLVVDDEGRIVRVNDKLLSYTGYTREDLIGQSVDLMVPSRFRAGHQVLRKSYDARTREMGKGRKLMTALVPYMAHLFTGEYKPVLPALLTFPIMGNIIASRLWELTPLNAYIRFTSARKF